MGTSKPEWAQRPQATQRSVQSLLFGAAIVLVAVVGYLRLASYEEAPTHKLSLKEETQLQKRLQELDDSEQYALLAEADGWYPCLHRGRATYYLKVGEVWKYGVTSKGRFGRYGSDFLLKHNVAYLVEFKGNFAECLKQEQIKLFNYPYLPENLARPLTERLPRPPYNSIRR